MKHYAEAVNQALETFALLLPDAGAPVTAPEEAAPGAGEVPQPLRSAMRYSLLLPGKRIRPALLLAAYHLLAEDWQKAMPYACALEMIHTYSLIHDDLPAMDDDAFRRGKPTNHKVYGEGMAILAGDGLLNMAYETMLEADITRERPAQAVAVQASGAWLRARRWTCLWKGQCLSRNTSATFMSTKLPTCLPLRWWQA